MWRLSGGRATILVACLAASVTGCATRAGNGGPAPSALTDRTSWIASEVRGGRARSVILLVGDGMGDSEITMARNYQVGAAGRLALDTLPLTGACTTYAVLEENPALPDYVVDSAASATAWATGRKTSNRRLSTAARTDESLTTIFELARDAGLATGSVTTAELTDATPAALVAHVNNRACQGPADMTMCPRFQKSVGGPGSIAEQTVDHQVDVLLGGGRQRFEQVIDAGPHRQQTVLQSAIAQGYSIVTDAAELQTVQPGKKVLGLFAPAEMSPEWSGEPAARFPGTGPQRCVESRRPNTEPSLADMTRIALALLDAAPQSQEHGFILQVEGASIDKLAHTADPCGQIGETIALDAAVRVALDYARAHPDTLVVVTSDHAHAGLIVPPPQPRDYSPGVFSTLITADGLPMTISYATTQPGRLQEHTGGQVRIAAQGPQAANVVGVTDQTDLFFTVTRALGLPASAPAASHSAPALAK